MKFDEFQKKLESIKYEVIGKWDISLPFNTTSETIQKLILICRENLITEWHMIFKQPTDANPEPNINIYWDRRG